MSALRFGRRVAAALLKGITSTAVAFALITGNNPYKVGLDKAAALPDGYALQEKTTNGPVRHNHIIANNTITMPGPKPGGVG